MADSTSKCDFIVYKFIKQIFNTITDEFIKQVQDKINSRPRNRFNYENSKFVKNELLTKEKVALAT